MGSIEWVSILNSLRKLRLRYRIFCPHVNFEPDHFLKKTSPQKLQLSKKKKWKKIKNLFKSLERFFWCYLDFRWCWQNIISSEWIALKRLSLLASLEITDQMDPNCNITKLTPTTHHFVCMEIAYNYCVLFADLWGFFARSKLGTICSLEFSPLHRPRQTTAWWKSLCQTCQKFLCQSCHAIPRTRTRSCVTLSLLSTTRSIVLLLSLLFFSSFLIFFSFKHIWEWLRHHFVCFWQMWWCWAGLQWRLWRDAE